MVWCYNCTRHQPAQSSRSSSVCCHGCGKVVNQETGSKKRSFSGVAVGQHEQEVNNFNAGKSLKFDLAKFRVSKNAQGAINGTSPDDSESLSDIDDAEIRSYLLKDDEMLFKKMMWEKLNKEYIKAEAAKKAAAANAAKLKKEKQQRQAAGAKKAQDTAKTAKKKTSSRVNYDVLNKLLGESEEASEKSKKSRTDSYCEDDATSNKNESGHHKFTDWGILDDNYEDNNEKYQNDPYHDYEEGQYYDDDDHGDDLF